MVVEPARRLMKLTRRKRNCVVVANWRDLDHPEAGGAELYCERLAAGLVDMGYEVVLLTARAEGHPRTGTRSGFEIVRLGGRFSVYPLALLWLLLHRRSICGVVDSQNGIPFFTPVAVGRKTPVILLLHHIHQEQFALYFPPAAAAVGRWLESAGSRLVYGDRVVAAVSPSTRRGARRELRLPGPLFVVPPGTETALDSRVERRQRSSDPTIVCVGRLVPHKRYGLFVEALPEVFRAHPTLRVHIIGEGPERAALTDRAAELGIGDRVQFHGALPALDRDRLVRTAWLSINTSKGEGWSLTVVEANALGVPVLALRVPGLRDSIRHGETGWLIDESADLSAAVSDALAELTDDDAARRLSHAAWAWASRFTWSETAHRMGSILEAERGRLAHRSDDRRHSSDLAMVVHVPEHLLPAGWYPDFRTTDRVSRNDHGLTVLLPGTDAESARQALRRAGLPGSVVGHAQVRTAVARPLDHIAPPVAGWRFGGEAEPDLFIAEPIPDESSVVPLDPASR